MKGRTVHFITMVLCLGVLGIMGRAYGGPLDDWSAVTSGTTNHLRAIAFGGGRFVAAGDNGTVLTSLDGISWTLRSSGVTNSIYGLAYGSGKFVAVGSAGLIKTSSDGVTWVPQNPPIFNFTQLNAVTAADFGFVTVGNSGTILISSNGSNWIPRSLATSQNLIGTGVGFGKVFFGAAANAPALFWSTNGSDWSYVTNVPPASQPDLFNGGFVTGDGVTVGVGSRGLFYRTEDGDAWTRVSSPFFYCFAIANARHTFVTVGGDYEGIERTVGTSTNGLNWQTRYFKNNEGRLLSVAYGNHRFVAVGDGGAIVVSDPLMWLSNPNVVGGAFKLTLNGESNRMYRIQKAINISGSWHDVATVTNGSDSVEVTLPISEPAAFYRAVY
jgi:hypothetical protein